MPRRVSIFGRSLFIVRGHGRQLEQRAGDESALPRHWCARVSPPPGNTDEGIQIFLEFIAAMLGRLHPVLVPRQASRLSAPPIITENDLSWARYLPRRLSRNNNSAALTAPCWQLVELLLPVRSDRTL